MRPLVELVTTGNELLSGRTISDHARTVGDNLTPLGLRLIRDTTVPDDIEAVRDAVSGALSRVDIVMVSGGLGPTNDDLTRDALASLLHRRIVTDAAALAAIEQRYARLGRATNAAVRRHALVLEGAEVFQNSAGLAPGQRLDVEGKALFVLPGPPREFQSILAEHILPWLKQQMAGIRAPVVRDLRVCGLGESDVVSRLRQDKFPESGVDVAFCARPGQVDIRLTAEAGQQPAVERTMEALRRRIGPFIFAEDLSDMEAVVGRLLSEKKATLATAESCTGGLVGHRITRVSGSSAYYRGGLIAYANDLKLTELGVSPETLQHDGAVSETVARQMAEGARRKYGADYGLSVTGIAGPTGGTESKPVGLVYVAVADAEQCWVREHKFAGGRAVIKEWSSQMALDLLRRRLLGQP
jgi:nicotinamide-nucleotide amidase